MNTTSQETPPPARISHWIGRCPRKGCKVRHHVDIPLIPKRRYDRGIIGVPGSARPYWAFEPEWSAYSRLGLHCAAHRWAITWQQVDGRHSEEHKCDSRCLNATGPNCECQCGGANHGRGNHIEL